MSRRPTLRDVALAADVAVSTVSGILNERQDSWASKETRDRVFEAVRRLGYKPNKLARGLRLKRSSVATLLIPDLSNSFYAIMVRAFRRSMNNHGYELLVEETGGDPRQEARILHEILEHHTDGIMGVLSSPEPHAARLSEISKQMPVLLLGPPVAESRIDTVVPEFQRSFEKAILHLEAQGHMRVGFVDTLGGNDPLDRFAIFRSVINKHRLQFSEGGWIRCTPDFGDIRASVRVWAEMVAREDRTTALFCANDVAAVCTIRGLLDAGFQVPRDMAVVGFDDIPLASYLTCPLTTIAQPIDAMAETSAGLLIERIEGRQTGPGVRIAMPTRLVLRESTDASISSSQPRH